METLLRTLLSPILPLDLDSVLLTYIEVVLPAIEQAFGMIPAADRIEDNWFPHLNDLSRVKQLSYGGNAAKHNLLVYLLNSLLITWELVPLLNSELALSNDEKRLLCLGFTFQCCKNHCHKSAAVLLPTSALDLGATFNFDGFWVGWYEHLPKISYLAQIADHDTQANTIPTGNATELIPVHRLNRPIHQLLSFGTLAAQLSGPADIVTHPIGAHLQSLLRELDIDRTLTYHRLRNFTGLLTSSIHNAVLHFAEALNWHPVLFFVEGVVYLAPFGRELPDHLEIRKFVWEKIRNTLSTKMLEGEAGFKRDGKGLKAAPQILELLSPFQLIQSLPRVIKATIKNEIDPVTPKRLEKLNLSEREQKLLAQGADLRSDRIAEFIIFLQKQFFGTNPDFIAWVLGQLGIQAAITLEQTQVSSAGVNWGWYRAAAYYAACNPQLDLKAITEKLQGMANQLATWAEERNFFPTQISPSHEVFDRYLDQYLELPGWNNPEPSFQQELETYTAAKAKAARQPICSLSSGEFPSEDQMDSVVLFKPQQYSNKNPLGGRQLKRGISKLWSLEMLLRQACWSIPAGKLEEQQPVFLYLFPAFAHWPQITKALRILVNQFKRVNLWKICQFWQEHGMDSNALRFYPWSITAPDPNVEEKDDLPFLAITYTVTRRKTTTDAWVEPALLALVLPMMLGIQVVATASSVPLYNRGNEVSTTVQIDGPASFWTLLGFPTCMHLEEVVQGRVKHLNDWLDRLLIAYSIHLDCRANPPEPRWQLFPSTVRAIMTDILAIFSFAHSRFQSPSNEKVQQYWHFAQTWATGDSVMEQQLELTQRLVQEYRTFYRVHVAKSTHAIVLPLSKVLEDILSTPGNVPIETLVLQTSGRLHDALRRQEPFKRPLIMDKSLSIEVRATNEIQAIRQFVITCINDLFLGQYKGDRALLQEHRHRIKSGAEFAYRLLAIQEKSKTEEQDSEGGQV
ncbi:MAG: type I-D CRISPR-associated protein Cas10d/Csc3 [Leptolyngbya sp. BL-A-14]